MKEAIWIVFSIFILNPLQAQQTIKEDLFCSMDDYMERMLTETGVMLLVKDLDADPIWFEKFVDEQTGKKI